VVLAVARQELPSSVLLGKGQVTDFKLKNLVSR
jgi:hypothetical protein